MMGFMENNKFNALHGVTNLLERVHDAGVR